MRFMLLTPGTGHFYCGSCLRDNALGTALTALGHEVDVVPLYLPRVLEDPEAAAARTEQVHMGGINMYLQQKSRLARRLPGWLARFLDSPKLLRWVSTKGSMTEAPDLGAMTVSMLRGEVGHQAAEVEKLVAWAAAAERPDVIVLANVMLSGVVRCLRDAIDCPVVVTLQGEQPFLDALPEPFKTEAWDVLVERAAEVDAFVPVSNTYGEVMRQRLGLPAERVHTVHNGLDLTGFPDEPVPLAARRPRTIGYLARMCRDKGLHVLVDACVELARRRPGDDVRLHVVGVVLNEDKDFVEEQKRRLDAAGFAAEFSPNATRAEKLAFLSSLSVLSVPATYGESFGLYVLEALAAGVPVVQPRHAAFPEILEATGGGLLCEPDDAVSLADGLESLLDDERRAQDLATEGRRVVAERFQAEHMARNFAETCERVRAGH